MEKRVTKTIIAIVLIIIGIAVIVIFDGNVFGLLNLPSWAKFMGIPFVTCGLTLLILTNRKQK